MPVVGAGDGLATVGGAADQVAELGTGGADGDLNHVHVVAQDYFCAELSLLNA